MEKSEEIKNVISIGVQDPSQEFNFIPDLVINKLGSRDIIESSKILNRTVSNMVNFDKVLLCLEELAYYGYLGVHKLIWKWIGPNRGADYGREVGILLKDGKIEETKECPECKKSIKNMNKDNKRIRMKCKHCGHQLLPEWMKLFNPKYAKSMPLVSYNPTKEGYAEIDYFFEYIVQWANDFLQRRVKRVVKEILDYIVDFEEISKNLDGVDYKRDVKEDLEVFKQILAEIFSRIYKFKFFNEDFVRNHTQISWDDYFEHATLIQDGKLCKFYSNSWKIVEKLKIELVNLYENDLKSTNKRGS